MLVRRLVLGFGALTTALVQPLAGQRQKGLKVTRLEYEGWRQYSVHCARCHGQDVLGNQIKAIYTYIKGRAEKRIPPGRPAQPAG